MLPARTPAPDLSNARRDVRAIPCVVSWRLGTLTSLYGAAGVVCLSERVHAESLQQILCAASGPAGWPIVAAVCGRWTSFSGICQRTPHGRRVFAKGRVQTRRPATP